MDRERWTWLDVGYLLCLVGVAVGSGMVLVGVFLGAFSEGK